MLGYIGSKKSLLPFLDDVMKDVIIEHTSFADLFAGTGSVSQHFKDTAKNIVVNDSEWYSYIINFALLKVDYSDKLGKVIENLNTIKGVDGLIIRPVKI